MSTDGEMREVALSLANEKLARAEEDVAYKQAVLEAAQQKCRYLREERDRLLPVPPPDPVEEAAEHGATPTAELGIEVVLAGSDEEPGR